MALLTFAVPLCAKELLASMPLYQSVEDPPGQQRTRILAEGSVLHFGDSGSDRHSLRRSDLGLMMYFYRVDGGVRVRGEPIIFPDGTRKQFRWEDFSCSAIASRAANHVSCRRNSDGQLFHSILDDGGLVSFDARCFGMLDRVCHYRLIDGRAIRPTHIAAS